MPGDAVFATELHGGFTVSHGAAAKAPQALELIRVRREGEKKLSVLQERRVSRRSTSHRQAVGKLPMLLILNAILRSRL